MLQQIESISIAKQTDHTVAAAQSLLHHLNVINYKEPIEIINNQKRNLRLIGNNENDNTNATNNFSIYPNPTKEQFSLTHNYDITQGNITLTVYDIMGRIMLTETVISKKQTINTSSLKAGVYLINLMQNNHILTTNKIVIK